MPTQLTEPKLSGHPENSVERQAFEPTSHDIERHRGLSVFVFIFSVLVCLSGCSTVNPAHTQSNFNLRSLRSVYVVTHGGSSADMDAHMQDALVSRGLIVRAGPETAKPSDIDFYVTYADSWQWDFSMFLKELHIQFYDAKNGALIASGSFSNSFLHTYPDPGKKVAEVIATIYGEETP
jgi:hypothetical protein